MQYLVKCTQRGLFLLSKANRTCLANVTCTTGKYGVRTGCEQTLGHDDVSRVLMMDGCEVRHTWRLCTGSYTPRPITYVILERYLRHSSYTQGINESANFRFLQRLSVIFGFRWVCPWSPASCRDYCPRKTASCRDCPCDSASCRDSRQEAKSHGQSLQEAIYRAQQSRQEARDRGQSQRKPNITDSLCRKRKIETRLNPVVYVILQ